MCRNIGQNDLRTFFRSNGGVNRQLIVFGLAPAHAGDMLIIGGSRLIRAADIALCLLERVAVNLPDSADAKFHRSMDKHAHDVLVILQNIVRASAHNDAASVIGDLPYDLLLRLDCVLHDARAQIKVAQDIRRIFVYIGNELLIKAAFVGGKRDHLLVIERYAQLFGNELADLLSG